jgi:hypothetical protein
LLKRLGKRMPEDEVRKGLAAISIQIQAVMYL